MCGRFTRNYTLKQVQEYLNLIPARAPSNFPPSFNVCPTDIVDAAVQTDAGKELQPMRWGLVPGWWKKTLTEANRLSTFNAGSEEVLQKPFFKSVFGRKTWAASKLVSALTSPSDVDQRILCVCFVPEADSYSGSPALRSAS